MYYGFDFTKQNNGGLGALIHDVMIAVQYAEQNHFIFCFTKEGYDIPRLNGSYKELDIPDKTWHSFFTSFPIIETKKCYKIWPDMIPNTKINKWSIEDYSDLLKDSICIFRPEIENEIEKLVKQTPFNVDTDIVMHFRLTDKITESLCFIPSEIYIRECEDIISLFRNEKNRIYICTDDKKICKEIQEYFNRKKIDVVWDDTESDEELQYLRLTYKLSNVIAQNETMNAFKNLFIMKQSKYLIGCRSSYFFRIAELLRYPKKTSNLQDNNIFGIAPYSSVNYMIRPYKKNMIYDFINTNIYSMDVIQKYKQTFLDTNIVNIPNFISENVLSNLRFEIENYNWWCYTILPNDNVWESKIYHNLNDPILQERFKECHQNLKKNHFTYRFKRDFGNHYYNCNCIVCKLRDTVTSFPVTDLLCKIVGCKNMTPNEMFLSNYTKGDFLSIHHDVKKGDIAVTFSFCYDWNPCYGGILHFCDEDNNIYKSIVPKLGSVNIFKIDLEKGINHFVSHVSVNKNRYTFIIWYNLHY